MLKLIDKKIITVLGKLFLLTWPYDLFDFRSINFWFGSMVLTKSGILLNNQMADFSLPKEGNKLVSIETLCILETPKQVLLQTVKIQIKCSIMNNHVWDSTE